MALSPVTVINLMPVRNSGVYLPVAILSLLLLLVGVQLLRAPGLVPWRSRVSVPLIALAATAVLSGLQGAFFYDRSVLGQHRYVLVQIYAVALVCLSVGAAFATAALLRSTGDVRWVRRIFIALAAVLLVNGRLDSPLPTAGWWPMLGGHALAMALASLLFEAQQRWWLYALGAVFAAAVVLDVSLIPFVSDVPAQWISGWLVVGVPAAMLLLCRFPRAIALGVVPASAVLLYWQLPLVERVFVLAQAEGDFLRLRMWHDSLRITLLRPILGVGPGNYLDYAIRYAQIGLTFSSPHGNYQQIAAEMGLVGLGFALWLFYRALALGVTLFRNAADPLVRSMSIAAVCSLAGQLGAASLGDFVLPSYHNGGVRTIGVTVYAFVVMGVLMSLERLRQSPPSEPRP
jgi:O-antigen ligase